MQRFSVRPTQRCREAEGVEFQSNISISEDINLSPFLPSDMKQANVRLLSAEQLINLLFTCFEVTSENSEVSPRLQSHSSHGPAAGRLPLVY